MATPFDFTTGQGPGRALSQMQSPFRDSPQKSALAGALGAGLGAAGGAMNPPTGGPPPGPPGPPMPMPPLPQGFGMPAPPDPHAQHMQIPGYGSIRNAYSMHLGRDGNPDDLLSHLGPEPHKASWPQIQYAISNIANSPEAQLNKKMQSAQKAAQGPAKPGQAADPTAPTGPTLGTGQINTAYGQDQLGVGGSDASAPQQSGPGMTSPTQMPNVGTPGGDLRSDTILSGGPGGAPAPQNAALSNIFNIGADARNGWDGTTYAGFSPQNHQGADLNDPMNAKYALQQYMVNNGALTGGQGGNAKAISDALNSQYGSAYGNANFFNPTDAETIEMPDGQYVHADVNGHGMAPGTYNPSNTNEVLWGSHYGPDGGPPQGGQGQGQSQDSLSPMAQYAMNTPGLLPQGAPPQMADQIIQALMKQLALSGSLGGGR